MLCPKTVCSLFIICTTIILFLSLEKGISANANDVLGCNGLVKSNVGEIDFTKLEVKLFTKLGSLKERAELSPNNGYYFLPLYDKGEYVLKVSSPFGWYIEPSEVTVYIDGTTDPCSLGKDINFVLQGFAVTGQVASVGTKTGPKGVTIKLLTTKRSPEIIISSTTSEGGTFILSPVKPGQYVVEASHDRWIINRKQVHITVENHNTVVPDNSLMVAGYDVSGVVTTDREPIQGVSFVLFQSIHDERFPVTGCNSSALAGFSPSGIELKELVPICHVISDTAGHFTFPCLPSGKYTVVPHYKSMHSIQFDVHPQYLEFQVNQDSLKLPSNFQVKGFSVDGRVLWSPEGKPVQGATVILNGKVLSKTRADGVFHLDSMSPGTYKLLIQAQNVEFKEQNVKVTASTPHIGDIVPSAYRVCGRVSTSQPGLSAGDRPVEFHLQDDAFRVNTTIGGEYCVLLPPGTYSVSLPITDAERNAGLQFAPVKRLVKVKDSPMTGVDFSQLRATVRGSIKCLSSPCPEIPVTLKSLNTSITILSKGDSYVFENVLPGEYSLAVPSEVRCWQTVQYPLTVSMENVEGATFIQNGVPIPFMSSHQTKVKYRLEGSNSSKGEGVTDVVAGSSRVCVRVPGVYSLEPVGCHGYAAKAVRWTGGLVTLTAISHLYTGRVLSTEHASDLVINVIPSEDNSPPSRVRKLECVRVQGEKQQYVFSTQLAVGEAVTLVPAASALLFTPMVAAVVGADHCVEESVVFRAERGLVVEGHVMGGGMPVAGASVSIRSGDHHIATQVTDSEGRYMFGPLSAHTQYNVTAEKEGYMLTGPDSKGEFNARKLAEVIVSVVDKESSQPLQSVLLLLNGEDYRRAILTGPDGTQAFLSLNPGEYYLRPMMKEYQFEPHSKVIKVEEGATVKITVSGERVAFSVWGSVTSLNGEVEPGIVVEAVGLGTSECGQFQEESTTDVTGQFRIRGLQPECKYSVRMKQDSQVNQHIERSTPSGILVKVTKEDLRGLIIVVFRPISRTDVTMYVTAEDPDHLRTLRVRMLRDDTIVHSARPSQTLKASALVFPPIPADGRTYSVQLESTLSQKAYNYQTYPVYFTANSSFQVVRLHFVTTTRASESELSHTSYLILPLLVIILAVIYKRQEAKVLLIRLLDTNKSQPNDSSGGEALSIEQISVKRKIRQRKS